MLRSLTGVVLVVAVGLVPLLPAEHVHELTDADGHHEAIAHSHTAAHVLIAMHDDDGATVDHPDGIIVSLDAPYTAPAAFVNQVPAIDVVAFVLEPDASVVRGGRAFLEPPAHGPPRSTAALRAPPTRLA